MLKFRSKAGMGLFIPMMMFFTWAILQMAIEHMWGGVAIMTIVIVFICNMWANTYYTVNNNMLHIRCGFMKQSIDIKSIRRISESNNLLSSPALSLDRLEILYEKFDTVLISPKDKQGFISAIIDVNPDVAVVWKKK